MACLQVPGNHCFILCFLCADLLWFAYRFLLDCSRRISPGGDFSILLRSTILYMMSLLEQNLEGRRVKSYLDYISPKLSVNSICSMANWSRKV